MGNTADVVIVGAGLTGLSTAYYLKQQGFEPIVFEKESAVGGVIQSQTIETPVGLIQVEWGPHTVQGSASALLTLAHSLGLSPLAASPDAQRRYLWHQNQLRLVPTNPFSALTTPLLSPWGKIRLLLEAFQRPLLQTDSADPNVADWVTHRLGREVLDHLVAPFLSGVYAGNPTQMSAAATLKTLAAYERRYGSITAGVWNTIRSRHRANTTPQAVSQSSPSSLQRMGLYSFENGMQQLPTALAFSLGKAIQTQSPIHQLQRLPNGLYQLETPHGTWQTPAVILTTPAPVCAQLLQANWAEHAGTMALSRIPYAPMTVVHTLVKQTAFDAHPSKAVLPTRGFGCLIPRQSGMTTLGHLWIHSLFPNRVPEQYALLTSFVGGATAPESAQWPLEKVEQRVLQDLQTTYHNTHPIEPIGMYSQTLRQAIPQYTVGDDGGHLKRIRALEALEAQHPGLWLGGNFRSGVSLNDCVKEGLRLAQAAIPYLTTTRIRSSVSAV
ncbi:MAG: protoporphyrinogen oxidase [Vampirovibrionales bacterium]